MNTTQEHITIADVQDNIILLKDGGGALILKVSAVNFSLLSDREQIGIIGSFAQMLNSLSFSIQIVIFSQRLNISSYLNLLDTAQKIQTNPLLSKLISEYRQFIQSTIKDNDVLDKQFYIVIPLFKLELGLTTNKEILYQKIKTILLPRRDQIGRQLARVGLEATQLTGPKLIELFYNIYNNQVLEKVYAPKTDPAKMEVKLNPPATSNVVPSPAPIIPQSTPQMTTQQARNHPFVVEELSDNV